MPVMQSVFGHNEFAVGIEHDEIRIVPSGKSALARVATSESSRLCRHPTRQIEQGESSPAGFRPHQRERHGKACNAAPGGLKITLVEPLHRWRTRRMVGRHQIDGSVS